MGDWVKNLGQGGGSGANLTLQNVYAVPNGASAVVSSLIVCNRGPTTATFRVAVAKAAIADALSQYIYYDLPIIGNDTFIATVGLTLDMTDVVRFYASNANLNCHLYGTEITP
jgi:hypothetical protein